jgi:hypothetical protein
VDQSLLPTFIIGGAPRSGTTFLCHALERHPDVYLARPYIPEPKVFMGPIRSEGEYRARYRELFAGAAGRRALGEKTSYYLESAEASRLIRATLPDVRLLFILREPVARAYSNYLWTKKNGLETLCFEEAVEQEGRRASPLPPDKTYARPFDYLARGDYAALAEPYLKAFGRDRVAFFLFEDIIRQPEKLFHDLQSFIGVEALPQEQLNPGIVNSAREMGPQLDTQLERKLKQRMAAAVDRFARLTGLDLSVWA